MCKWYEFQLSTVWNAFFCELEFTVWNAFFCELELEHILLTFVSKKQSCACPFFNRASKLCLAPHQRCHSNSGCCCKHKDLELTKCAAACKGWNPLNPFQNVILVSDPSSLHMSLPIQEKCYSCLGRLPAEQGNICKFCWKGSAIKAGKSEACESCVKTTPPTDNYSCYGNL
jgi:hypothetical protein